MVGTPDLEPEADPDDDSFVYDAAEMIDNLYQELILTHVNVVGGQQARDRAYVHSIKYRRDEVRHPT